MEEAELGDVAGLRALHLQCHFGADTLTLAQRGASVVGLDFSPAAIEAANDLAAELGLAGAARFVLADLYDAPSAVAEPHAFDLVYVTWGATCWLPDLGRWAAIVASFLKPGGRLYYADAHPTAYIFDDETKRPTAGPAGSCPTSIASRWCWSIPRTTPIRGAPGERDQREWLHPLSDILNGLIDAGLTLDWLHEHAQVPWRMFQMLEQRADGDWHWPDRPWLPLGLSLQATRR